MPASNERIGALEDAARVSEDHDAARKIGFLSAIGSRRNHLSFHRNMADQSLALRGIRGSRPFVVGYVGTRWVG